MFQYLFLESKRLKQDEGGQTLVFTALVCIILFVFVALTFNVGNMIVKRVDMQGTVDAAAIQGAAWQARGYNLISLFNGVIKHMAAHHDLEIAQGVFWCMPWMLYIDPTKCPIQALDAVDEGLKTNEAASVLNGMQAQLAGFWIPLTVLGENIFGIMDGGRFNDADLTITGGGTLPFWPYLPIWPRLYIKFEGINWAPLTFVETARLDTANNKYPTAQFVFAACYRSFKGRAPLYPNVFNTRSYILDGHLTLAQARPYVPRFISSDPRNLHGKDFNFDISMDWDVKLMPITVDNRLLAIVPILGPIVGLVVDLVLVH